MVVLSENMEGLLYIILYIIAAVLLIVSYWFNNSICLSLAIGLLFCTTGLVIGMSFRKRKKPSKVNNRNLIKYMIIFIFCIVVSILLFEICSFSGIIYIVVGLNILCAGGIIAHIIYNYKKGKK